MYNQIYTDILAPNQVLKVPNTDVSSHSYFCHQSLTRSGLTTGP